MIKNGQVEIGKTPSEVSGKPCTHINEDGIALCKGEENKYTDIVKRASKDLDMASGRYEVLKALEKDEEKRLKDNA